MKKVGSTIAGILCVVALVSIFTIENQVQPAFAYTSITITKGSSVGQACVAANNCFDPANVQIAPGDTITWTNADTALHEIRSGKPSDKVVGDIDFETGLFSSGKTISMQFSDEGTFNYYCVLHPWMIGQIVVSNGISTQPPVTSTTSNIPTTNTTSNIPTTNTTSNTKITNKLVSTVPQWVKNVAKWWSEGSLTDNEFIKGIQYLIQQGIIIIPHTQSGSTTHQIPTWIKNTAGWWANGQISDDEFVKGIQWLITNGIIAV